MAKTIKPTTKAAPKTAAKPKVTPKATPKPTAKPKVTPKPSAKPSPSKTKVNPMDMLIKEGVKKLSPSQREKLAKLLGIKYDPKVFDPNYGIDPKELNPNWKP
jgi:hypothetical protein